MIRRLIRRVRGTCPDCGAKIDSLFDHRHYTLMVFCTKCPFQDESFYEG